MSEVRERLERLMRNPSPRNKVDVNDILKEQERQSFADEEDKLLTPNKVMVQRLEKAIKAIEDYNSKMLKDSESYLSLFYDRKKAEQQFLDLLKEAEEKKIQLPQPFMQRIRAIKSKIRDKPL